MPKVHLLALLCVGVSALAPARPRVVVAGATGRVGQLVVSELLARNATVLALVRDAAKAAETLPVDANLDVSVVKLTDKAAVAAACAGASCGVWCVTGFSSDGGTQLGRLLSGLALAFKKPADSFDATALAAFAGAMCATGGRVVACSSAGITRPTWSDAKKARYPGAADIPIVRLNPLNILGVKVAAEQALRGSGTPYTIVRPTGLNDAWPRGRPVFSSGDLAVGRISRIDVASVLATLALDDAGAVGKTFECFALAGYPQPNSIREQLSRLPLDAALGSDDERVDIGLDATYALLQQLVPGATLQPDQLAMGQTYEQLDNNETGRLGVRGEEIAPIAPSR